MSRRRSPPHPQIQAREEVARVACRRSPRLHPQIEAGEDGTGMARHRSPRLHPQIDASEDGAGTVRCIRRRRGKSPAEPVSLPDGDDILREILVRLSPQPSSLPRASAICKRWRGLITDPKFHRQFRAHHRKPPLLRFFETPGRRIVFTSVPPDRIPPQRFDLGLSGRNLEHYFLDCRHGLVLVKNPGWTEVVVCDPITGHQRRLAVPFELKKGYLRGAVLCAAGDHGHVHGGCHLGPFKVVLLSTDTTDYQPLACVYSSETDEWGNIIAPEARCDINAICTFATLVGNVLYWMFGMDRVLEFDLDRHYLAVTLGPPVTNDFIYGYRWIIQAENGAVGFARLNHPRFQMWQRNASCQGVSTWVPWKTIDMHNILRPSVDIGDNDLTLRGYDEDNDLIFVSVNSQRIVYSVHLKSMESKKLCEACLVGRIHPFTSFYTPGKSIDAGSNGAEVLHST